jgi:hypothetical protein
MEERKFERIEEAYIIYRPTCFYCERRNWKNGLMNEKLNLGMDSEFWLRLGKRGLRLLEIPHNWQDPECMPTIRPCWPVKKFMNRSTM